jgi:imidazoleglycerol-phosphate dehydratase
MVTMRSAEVRRSTTETDVRLSLSLDGSGKSNIDTGIGFLDHMLGHLAKHSLINLDVSARGDLHVDPHHTVEDVALALGQALQEALGDKRGINRMGSAHVPMDEALAFAAVDISGRPYAVSEAAWACPEVGGLPVSLVLHFFESMAAAAHINLHTRVVYGRDDHHKAEALFKAVGRALGIAVKVDPHRQGTIPSTKGAL